MGLGVLFVHVMAVVGGQQRRAEAAGDVQQQRVHLALVNEAVVRAHPPKQ